MEKTILVVTEHDDVRRTLRIRLAIAFPHYLVIEAAGEEAVAIVLRQSPCLVIIDMGIEAKTQLEVARRIKSVQPAVQIVVWTIHDWQSYRTDALAAGASAYVLKEANQDNLLTVLVDMLAA